MLFRTTAARLRQAIADGLSPTIETHRASRRAQDRDYQPPMGPPTDEEIDDFLASNPLFEPVMVEQLTSEGFLGYEAKRVTLSSSTYREFREAVNGWAENEMWLAADEPWLVPFSQPQPLETVLWLPETDLRPSWVDASPSALLLAAEILASGRMLHELHWRDFEFLVGELLEREGWSVCVTRGSRDGGIDIVAERIDPIIGQLKALWQAKKYSPTRKVRLSEVRELSALRTAEMATKALVVTTSRLTSGALDWIRRDTYGLGYKEGQEVEAWVKKSLGATSDKDA